MRTTEYTDIVINKNFDNLLALAQQRLEILHLADRKNVNIIRQLIDIYRKRGFLDKLKNKTIELLKESDSKYDIYLKRIFCQESISLPCKIDGMKAAPFVILDDFLLPTEQETIWRIIDKNSDSFIDSEVSDKGVNKKLRKSKMLEYKKITNIGSFFLPKVEQVIQKYLPHLQIEPFYIKKKEMQLTLHSGGHFLTVHKDAGLGSSSNREVTYVYYFHQLPKSYTGGDLLLFDTNKKEDIYSTNYTRITTQNNMLILFPSFCYHQVTPVFEESGDYLKGRFTLNGWFHQ